MNVMRRVPPSSVGRFVGNVLVACVALIVLVAGILKIRDIDLFRQSLDSWKLVPSGLRSVIAVLVPLLEVAMPSAWLLGLGRLKAAIGMLALLIAFTGVYSAHRIAGFDPECNCLGEIMRMQIVQKIEGHLIARNCVLILALVIGMLLARGGPRKVEIPGRGASGVTNGSLTRRAMTIVELLVVLATIALLIAILTPALGAIRGRARNAQDASNLRQHSAAMAQYVADWQDVHPIFLDPSRAQSTLTWNSRGLVFDSTPYFLSCLAWPVALADAYYDGAVAEDAFWSPNEPLSRADSAPYSLLTTSYNYPCAFLARPQYWNPSTRGADPAAQTGPTKASEVRFPSGKAIFVTHVVTLDGDLGGPAQSDMSIGLCDGSASRIKDSEGVASTVFADGYSAVPEWSNHFRDWPRLLHTPDGVYGRDFIRR